MVEVLISIEIPNSILVPIQVSIIYNEDGSVNNIDWRHAIDEDLDELDTIYERSGDEWCDEESDEDPSWRPGINTDTDTDSDDDDY